MKKRYLKDGLFCIAVLVSCFGLNLLLQEWFHFQAMIPTVFVLGVFIISWRTQGYVWGIASSLISVLAVNFAFTYPYFSFDLITPESVTSAVVMLLVAIVTGTLTTQLKRQQQIKVEMEKERMRGNLLRAVSHDLRTPLTSIYGASATVRENYHALTEAQQLALLEDIQEDAQWLIRMVENLLSVTRIDGEKVKVTKTPTPLEELIDTVLVKFQKRYPDQAVQLELPEEFVSIPVDPILIEQVLINILENAILHARGMEHLTLSVTCREHTACFAIRDDGCGIAPDRLENLFTGYLDRQDTVTDGSRNNMGIGLSVCATIIKAHGSEITARNLPEGGAEFTFTLETEDISEHEQIPIITD